ncbi:alpha/beta hydrolase [Legionella sp. PATHC035]|uniref:alpha/beta fold hydrolase n=1 Tax=Legionella sp. PATHC035 TaxID=2992040 RepID=UPI0022434950|nr:alpha/beta hydrolase [Legionella sp. PATHC035]MCW8408379.1 alpha/beta hydrolase [Legionella sp. PATHC035]
MWIKDLFIDIPKRDNAPETRLHIRIVCENEANLDKMPYVFMLPGGPGANHSHYKDYECLATTGNMVFIDPRGCGLSEKNDPSSYTMDNYIRDVDEIRKYLNLEKIVLLGKSYGAMCALGYTLTYPKYVSSLILAAGSPSFRNLETARLNVEKRGSLAQQKVCEQLWEGTFKSDEELDHFFDVMDSMYSWRKRHNLPVNRPAPDYIFAHEPLNQGFGGFLRTFNYEDRLHEITCNTLILVGEEDWITDKKHSEFMANRIPNNQYLVFEGADHSLESDVPELFFASIESFLKSQCEKRNSHHFFQNENKGEKANLIADETKKCTFG